MSTDVPEPGSNDSIQPPFHRNVTVNRLDDLRESMLIEAVLAGRHHIRQASVRTDGCQPLQLLPPGAKIRLTERTRRMNSVVAELSNDVVVRVSIEYGHTAVFAVGRDVADVDAVIDRICDNLARSMPSESNALSMIFWSSQGSASRMVSAPSWHEVAGNYSAGTVDAVGHLMTADSVQSRAGRLVLWHGAPGTGKTTAVRALAREWADWCTAHYVMDPEHLFADPAYLMKVVGDAASHAYKKQSWKLVIAEDCDEYLRADAKARAGASLGRLLNLSDGILGHGLQVILLLTTNEPLDQLHPAVTRPGRCLNQTEFLPLSPKEARVWLGGDHAQPPEGATTLAELFAIRERRARHTPAPDQPAGGYL